MLAAIMPAVCLNLLVIVCLYATALTHAVTEVQWRESGGKITIQCRISGSQETLDLRKGLNEEHQVFYFDLASKKESIAEGYQGRLQTHVSFPKVDILIKNLSQNDTGPYWCVYKRYDSQSNKIKPTRGDGCVLLVVKEPAKDKHTTKDEVKECDPPSQDLIIVCIVTVGAILLLIIVAFFIWIIRKKRSGPSAEKPRRVATNDVYEEMRGTVRH